MIDGHIAAASKSLLLTARSVAAHPAGKLTALLTATLLGAGSMAVASLAPDASDMPVREIIEAVQPAPLDPQVDLLQDHALRLYRSDTTRSSDNAESLLQRLGIVDPAAAAFLRSDPQARKALLGRAGRNVTAEASADNALLKLQARWTSDDSGNFQRLVVEKTPQGRFSATVQTAPLTASTRLVGGVIESSLFAATDEQRIPDAVATQVAEIFSGDIDFHRALRKGDRFSVVYETLEGDGEPLRSGRVLSAEFVNKGKTFTALWFQDPATADSPQQAGIPTKKGGAYYTLDGESLQRNFLISPLAFSRVTSGFKMRFHPIQQRWMAHRGVDYGAPTGTAIRTVANGVVEFAGVQNGFGNVVYVNHGKDTVTVYAHMSRIDVKRGQNVSQGDTIGAVGSTGWATGPHLHFEFRIKGMHMDPLTVVHTSESQPVSTAGRPAFERLAAMARTELSAAATIQATNIE